jgi:hypothetical protein
MLTIYEIAIGDRKYIGSTKDKRKRKTNHLRLLRDNKHFNPIMQAAYNKYEEYNFQVLVETDDELEMKKLEEQYIAKYKEKHGDLCMNVLLSYGGGSEWRKYKTTEELKIYDSKRWNLTPEQKELKNKRHSETVQSIPRSERQEWYDRAKTTLAKNIKTHKSYKPIHIQITFPDGTFQIEHYDTEPLFCAGTGLENTSLWNLKKDGVKTIKKRLHWTRHNFPVGTVLTLIKDQGCHNTI